MKIKKNAINEFVGKDEFGARLSKKLRENYNLKIAQDYMRNITSAIPEVITEILCEGKGISFHHAFSIGLKYIPEKTYSSFLTEGEAVTKPAHLTPVAKFAPSWKETIETSLSENGILEEFEEETAE